MIPQFKVLMDKRASKLVAEVLDSGYIGQGPKVEEFEKKLKTYLSFDYGVTVNSATSGLMLAIRLAGVEPGDFIVSTAMTCSASNEAITLMGANILWADVNKFGNIDPQSVAQIKWRLGEGWSEVKAIMAVDWGGLPCDYEELRAFKLPIIEDAAHAYGATYKDEPISRSGGDYVSFSFQAIKALPTGDGGLLVVPEKDYKRAKLLRWYGLDRESGLDAMRCLWGGTNIRLANGSLKTIKNIVDNKLDVEVLVDEDGQLIPRKIIDWHVNKLGERKYLKISVEEKKQSISVVTNDHKILTKRGWIEAGKLIDNELVATPFPAPSEIQKQIIIGSLLGDACIPSRCKNVIQEIHSQRQADYLELKAKALKGLNPRISYRDADQLHPKGTIIMRTPSLPSITEFYYDFYDGGNKKIPRKLIENNFSDLLLAIWYMDDGFTSTHNNINGLNYSCEIHTEGFLKEDVKWAVNLLQNKGYDCYLSKKNKYYIIKFTVRGSKTLISHISPYVPPSMRYKVGHDNSINYKNHLWGDGKSGIFYGHVRIRNVEFDYPNNKVYCISVDSPYQNFATTNLIVHNCKLDIEEIGWKFHMNDIAAAIGISNMDMANWGLRKNRDNAKFYDKHLKDFRPDWPTDRESSFWIYTIHVDNPDGFTEYMKTKGIQATQVHNRNDNYSCFKQYKTTLPNLDKFFSTMCAIPCGWWLSKQERQYIVDCVLEYGK